jgi:hypothetical protein
VRLQNLAHCTSITYMIRHYVARRAKVIEDHPHKLVRWTGPSGELTEYLSSLIASDRDLFIGCIIRLLESLLPADAEGWQLMSSIVKLREPYKWTFTAYRIEAEAAILDFLEEIQADAELAEQLKVAQWIPVALEKMYKKADDMRAAHEDGISTYIHDDDATTIGRAVSRIWNFDAQYRDTRSWFPPSHPFWPLHLPGQPQILQEWSLPEESAVANVAWLPWEPGAVAVGMSSGEILIFSTGSRGLIRKVSTGIFPAAFEYTRLAIMIIGPDAMTGERPYHQWLLLSEPGSVLASQEEPERIENPSGRKQKRKPAKLSRFSDSCTSCWMARSSTLSARPRWKAARSTASIRPAVTWAPSSSSKHTDSGASARPQAARRRHRAHRPTQQSLYNYV